MIDSSRTRTQEQPIFTTKAHVFQIDPVTKKNWLSLSDHALTVSFYHDSARNSYRIISVDDSKALINSTVSSGMTFTRTSHKFAQWSDTHANTVYGLGFETEPELTKFIEKFKEVKELSRNRTSKSEVNGYMLNDVSQINIQDVTLRTPSVSSIHSDRSVKDERTSYTGSSASSNGHAPATTNEAQLKYENDRLKLALAQSSANAKKWEVELQTLKNNNARLTTALQESTSNVEEWKKQLTAYKDESSRLKKKVLEMEVNQVNEETTTLLKREITSLTANLETSDHEIATKDQEIDRLSAQVSQLLVRDALSRSIQAKAQGLEKENEAVTSRLRTCERQVKELTAAQQTSNKHLSQLVTQSDEHITQSQRLHQLIVSGIRHDADT